MDNLWHKKSQYNLTIPCQHKGFGNMELQLPTSNVNMRIYCQIASVIAITNALLYTQQLHYSHTVKVRAVISLRRQRKSPDCTSFMTLSLLLLDKLF